jgi:hypothetical protein|tara:strand:- start:45 stop:299 length:255 start_codon:yes stop_codon:yes gene_type:complete
MDKQLIKAINRIDFEHSIDDDFENTSVYKVQGDETYMLFWNSSNGEEPDYRYVLPLILEYVIDGEDDGSISDGFNEIMFEIRYN